MKNYALLTLMVLALIVSGCENSTDLPPTAVIMDNSEASSADAGGVSSVETPVVETDQKLPEETRISRGGGPMEGCYKQPLPPQDEWPVITVIQDDFLLSSLNSRWLCVLGVPIEESLQILLSSPEHSLSYVQQFWISNEPVSENNPMPSISGEERQIIPLKMEGPAYAALVDGVPVMQVDLFWPAGLGSGEWQVTLTANNLTKTESLQMTPLYQISIRKDMDINPFGGRMGGMQPNEEILIEGTGLEPQKELLLGIYFENGERAQLVGKVTIFTDDSGRFVYTYRVPASFQNGTYYILRGDNENTELYEPTTPKFGVGAGEFLDMTSGEIIRIVTPPAAGGSSNALIVFDSISATLINTSQNPIVLKGIEFRRINNLGETTASFSTEIWRAVSLRSIEAFPASDCLIINTVESRKPSNCANAWGAFTTSSGQRQFWIATANSSQFEVWQEGVLLQTCDILAGSCEVLLKQP